ncbi:MAG: plastocyanin/azurin family copper-binding protein [Ferrovibrio sp.]
MRSLILAALTGLLLGGSASLYTTLANAQEEIVIVQQGIAFKPAKVSVKVGGKVTFRNDDPFGHNVYSPSQGGIFDIGLQAPESQTAVTFRDAGEYVIQCRIHPKMRAVVTVTP